MKANSSKQIRHKLEKVDTFENNFEKAVIKTYGEEDGIKFENCHTTENIDYIGECPVYLVYDEKEDGYTKTFRFVANKYEKDGKTMMKVVKILNL